MPTVPFVPRQPRLPQIDETYLAMAAADLHEAGLLFEPAPVPEPESVDVKESNRS